MGQGLDRRKSRNAGKNLFKRVLRIDKRKWDGGYGAVKAAIFGAGKAGKFLYRELRQHRPLLEIDAFVDTYLPEGETEAMPGNAVPLCRPEPYLARAKPDAAFIAAGSQKAIWQMMRMLLRFGVREIYFLQDIAGKNRLPLFCASGERIGTRLRRIRFSDKRPTLPYFEMPIVDACNLNCLGCLFGCNRHGESDHMALAEIERDFVRMAELFEDILWIRLLGGEPLLHPDLIGVLDAARRIFPETEIDVCTNGLALPKLPQDVLDAFVRNRITVHVSGYAPTYRLLNEIEAVLQKNGIAYFVLRREEFYKFYTLEPKNDPQESHAACPSSGCRELYRGRLAKCSAVLAFERMNKQFGTTYAVSCHKDYFSIHDEDLTGWDILQCMDDAVPACRYCDTLHMQKFPWQNGQPEKLSDYVL